MHDVDAQKKGVVMVVLNVGPNKMAFEDISFMMKSKRTMDSLPFRTSAMHYCYDDMMLYPFITFVQFLLMSRIKGRFVQHYGTFSLHRRWEYAAFCFVPALVLGYHPLKPNSPSRYHEPVAFLLVAFLFDFGCIPMHR